jgi:prophage regulatory protein
MKPSDQKIKEKILRLENVIVRTGHTRSTIYRDMNNNNFPKPISIGIRCVGWIESEIDSWVANQIQRSRNGSKK